MSVFFPLPHLPNLISQALKNDVPLKLPYSENGVLVLSTDMNLIFKIPILNAVITFGIAGFTVDLPYIYFGNNTQGHCGRSIFFSYLVIF